MGNNRSINQSGAVIPQDWHEATGGWAKVTFFIPDSFMWRVTVISLIDLLGQGRFWRSDGPRKAQNAQAIEIIDVIKTGRLIREFVMIKPEEYLLAELKTRQQIAKSLEEIEFTMKSDLAINSNYKTIHWSIEKPPPPSETQLNPTYEVTRQGVHEYKTTTGALMGMGEIMGAALLDDLDINPLPNPFGQSSKLDTLNKSLETANGKLETANGLLTYLYKAFYASFDLFPNSDQSIFALLRNSLNDTGFVVDRPYLNLIVENLLEKRFYLARFYALFTDNKVIKWTGLKPATPGTFSPNPTLTQTDKLETVMPQEVIDIRDRMNDIAGNSNEINHSLSESHWTFKHILARISKSGQIVNEMPRPLVGEAGISTNDSVFNTRMSDNNNITLTDSLITAFLFANGKSSYFEKIKDELSTIATTLSSPIRNLLEYIGNGLNISPFGSANPVGLAYLFVNALFRMGDWRFSDNSFLSTIADKDLSVTVTPNVTAKVDLNESAVTVTNQVNPTPVTVTNQVNPTPVTVTNQVQTPTVNITNNVDACCDNGGNGNDTQPIPDKEPVYEPIDPTKPELGTKAPYKPIITKIQPNSVNNNALCGYYYKNFNDIADWLEDLLDESETFYYIFRTLGLSAFISTLVGRWTNIDGFFLGKIPASSITPFFTALTSVLAKIFMVVEAKDFVIQGLREAGGDLACSLTDKEYLDPEATIYNQTVDWFGKILILEDLAQSLGYLALTYIKYMGLKADSSFAQYCPCPDNDIPRCNTAQPLQFGLGHSIVSAPFATNDTDNQVIPDEWSTPFLWAGSGYHQFTFEFDTLYNYGIPATTANVIGVFDLYIKVQRCADLQGTDAFDYINADFGLDSATQVYTIPDNVNIYGQPERLGWWTWEVSDNKLKVCIVVKTYDDWSSLSGYVAGSPFKGGYQYIRLAARPRVYINDPDDPTAPSGNSPFNVTPSGNNYTANWANVTIPSGATVTLTANNVTIPYTGNSVTGQFDPNQGVTLVLSVATNNSDGSVTTTTYTKTIDPIVVPKSFTAEITDNNGYFYLHLANMGQLVSPTLTINGYGVSFDSEGYLPSELQGVIGVMTFVITDNGNSYTYDVTTVAVDPCQGTPVTLGDIIVSREAYSNLVTVTFTIDPNVDTLEVYDNGVQIGTNSNTVETELTRGIEHVIRAVVHKYGAVGCQAEKTLQLTIPNLAYIPDINPNVGVFPGTDFANIAIIKGIDLQWPSPITFTVDMSQGERRLIPSPTPYDSVLRLTDNNIVALFEQDNNLNWNRWLYVEMLKYPECSAFTGNSTLLREGHIDYALAMRLDYISALITPPGSYTLSNDNVSGNLWLKLAEGYGNYPTTTNPTVTITDMQGIYRSSNVDLILYRYLVPLNGNYFSFQLHTSLSIVSVLMGVFSESGALLTTFYLQNLKQLKVNNNQHLLVSGYKYDGITLPGNAYMVTPIEVKLG